MSLGSLVRHLVEAKERVAQAREDSVALDSSAIIAGNTLLNPSELFKKLHKLEQEIDHLATEAMMMVK